MIRESAELTLNAARRRALVLQFAQLAAQRLQSLIDPDALPGALESF